MKSFLYVVGIDYPAPAFVVVCSRITLYTGTEIQIPMRAVDNFFKKIIVVVKNNGIPTADPIFVGPVAGSLKQIRITALETAELCGRAIERLGGTV